MNKKISLALAAALSFGVLSVPAMADFTDFASLIGSSDQINLHVSEYPSPQETDTSNPANFVGLTRGTLTDLTNPSIILGSFWMFCNDFNGAIGVPTDYLVNVVSLVGSDPSSIPDSGLQLPLGTLQVQALLGQNFGSTPSGNATFDSQIQHDIWDLDSPPPSPPFDSTPDSYTLAAEANASSPDADFSGSFLLDVTIPGGVIHDGQQAFMPVENPPTPPGHVVTTPEPGSFFLIGAGLLGFAVAGIRKRLA